MTTFASLDAKPITLEQWAELMTESGGWIREDNIERSYKRLLEKAPWLSRNVLKLKPLMQKSAYSLVQRNDYEYTDRMYQILAKLEEGGKYRAQWLNNSIGLSLNVVRDSVDISRRFDNKAESFSNYLNANGAKGGHTIVQFIYIIGLLYGLEKTLEVMETWLATRAEADTIAFSKIVERWDEYKDLPLSWAINLAQAEG